MEKYPVYYEGKEYCVVFKTYSIVVYLVEKPKNIREVIRNIWNEFIIKTITRLDAYYGDRVIIDGGNKYYIGDGDGNSFKEPEKNDDYYINLCKEAVKTAVHHYNLKNAEKIANKRREEKLIVWDGRV